MKNIWGPLFHFISLCTKKISRPEEIIDEVNHLFSLPVADALFSFHTSATSEIRKLAKEKWDTEPDGIVITSGALMTFADNPTSHNSRSKTCLKLCRTKGGKYVVYVTLLVSVEEGESTR